MQKIKTKNMNTAIPFEYKLNSKYTHLFSCIVQVCRRIIILHYKGVISLCLHLVFNNMALQVVTYIFYVCACVFFFNISYLRDENKK